MKKTHVKVKDNKVCKCYTHGQIIRGRIGLALLFVCGVMAGHALGPNCDTINQSLVQTVQEVQQQEKQKETCAVIENIQLSWLYDENSSSLEEHRANIRVYETLFQHGCEENKLKYREAISREMDILSALGGQITAQKSTCEKIEESLLSDLEGDYPQMSPGGRVSRANIFVRLSERGCSENKQKYVEMAKQELEIARALQDDRFPDNQETIQVIDAYKRLNMQAAAQEILDTMKRLTNPAIDFILEVERIINEK
ncbi:MAG: hypothetical protein IKZ34_01640 [Alphaproteobacteria bacterium]|nr:hypothetical protein [Alphaproteobacteria bacterium]